MACLWLMLPWAGGEALRHAGRGAQDQQHLLHGGLGFETFDNVCVETAAGQQQAWPNPSRDMSAL